MKIDISKDLSTLTTIDESTFKKLESKIVWCISDCIYQSIKNNENQSTIDLGFGIITISFTNGEVKYRFTPNTILEKAVANTIVNERNDLTLNIENSLISKLTNIYKSFF